MSHENNKDEKCINCIYISNNINMIDFRRLYVVCMFVLCVNLEKEIKYLQYYWNIYRSCRQVFYIKEKKKKD